MFIGIIGKARSGKDTFATMLAEELFAIARQRYVLIAYANELKIRVQRDFDMSYEQLWGNEKEVSDLRYPKRLEVVSSDPKDYWTPREVLQSYAEFYRSINHNFWVEWVFNLIDDKEYKNVILTDVRYVNEATPIKDRKGNLINTVRDVNKVDTIHGQDHISETSMDGYTDIDFTIENNGTLEELKAAAKDVAKILMDSRWKIKKINE